MRIDIIITLHYMNNECQGACEVYDVVDEYLHKITYYQYQIATGVFNFNTANVMFIL